MLWNILEKKEETGEYAPTWLSGILPGVS